jgi:hypothetical protein
LQQVRGPSRAGRQNNGGKRQLGDDHHAIKLLTRPTKRSQESVTLGFERSFHNNSFVGFPVVFDWLITDSTQVDVNVLLHCK